MLVATSGDPAAALLLRPADLAHISVLGTAADNGAGSPEALTLGRTGDGTITAGSLTLGADLILNDKAATIGLYASGAVTQTSGSIRIGRAAANASFGITGTITGTSGGDFRLGGIGDAAPANSFDALGVVSSGFGAVSVSEAADARSGLSGVRASAGLSAAGDLSLLVNAGQGSAGDLVVGSALSEISGNVTLIASHDLTGSAPSTAGPRRSTPGTTSASRTSRPRS